MEEQQIKWLALAGLKLSPRYLQLANALQIDWSACIVDERFLIASLKEIGYPLANYQSEGQRMERALTFANWCQAESWIPVCYLDEAYPQRLREISDPPLVIFCKGDIARLQDPQLAIVGSRHCSGLGESTANRFACELSMKGVSITSGLALGIDRSAHQGALQGRGGTLAVMATGPDRIYPSRNAGLAQQIIESGGLLVTEKLPGTTPKPYLFPERNRLISGLSMGTLVVEADLKSGSLITARLAMEQNREVMAVPGALTNPRARGCHRLIKQGAILVEGVDDILLALYSDLVMQLADPEIVDNSTTGRADESDAYPENMSSLLAALETEPLSVDQLILRTGLGISELSIKIAELELDGWVKVQGSRYVRIR